MRRVSWVLLLLYAACAPSYTRVEVPPGAVSMLQITFNGADQPSEVLAFEGPELRLELPEIPRRLAVLHFDRPLGDFELVVSEGALLTTTEVDPNLSAALPLPLQWTELERGRVVPRAVTEEAFAAAFSGIRVPRGPCPRVGRIVSQNLPTADGPITFAARLGADRVVLATRSEASDRVHLLGPSEDVLIAESSAQIGGFALPDGSVWFTRSGSAGPALCELVPAAPERPRCQQTVSPARFTPRAMSGQRVDGRLEVVAMSLAGELWLYREGEAWRLLLQAGDPTRASCQAAVTAQALELTGPGRGVAGFPGGPLTSFSIEGDGSLRTEPLISGFDVPSTTCRNAFARFRGGSELAVVSAYDSPTKDSSRVFWRPGASARWTEQPLVVGLLPLALVPDGPHLLASGKDRQVFVFDDAPRGGAPPRACPPSPSGSTPRFILALENGQVAIAGLGAPGDTVSWLRGP